jgi:hypothetical protein
MLCLVCIVYCFVMFTLDSVNLEKRDYCAWLYVNN